MPERRLRYLWRVWLVGESRPFEKRLFVGEEGEARAFLAGRRSAGTLNDCSLCAGEPSDAEIAAMLRERAREASERPFPGKTSSPKS